MLSYNKTEITNILHVLITTGHVQHHITVIPV